MRRPQLIYWTTMVLWLGWGTLWHGGIVAPPIAPAVNYLMLFILFFLVGWRLFGPARNEENHR